jgi:hypothetical protein
VIDGIAILTCARVTADPWQYLRETIESLGTSPARLSRRVIVCDVRDDDPPRPELDGDWLWVNARRDPAELPGGSAAAYWSLLRFCATIEGLDRLLVLEDDVIACRYAVDRVFSLGIPDDLGVVKYFEPWMIQPKSHQGLYRPPSHTLLWTQAVAFKGDVVRRIVSRGTAHGEMMIRASDNRLGFVLGQMGVRYGVHHPCIFQHSGGESAANPGEPLKWRTSHSYPGRNANAMDFANAVERYL